LIEEPIPTLKERKLRIFYPVLFAIFPILSIYSANLSLVPGDEIIRPVLIVLAVTISLWGALSLFMRSIPCGAVTSAFLVSMCFLYSRLVALMNFSPYYESCGLYIWIALSIVGALIVAWKAANFHKLLNVLSAMLVLAAGGQIGIGLLRSAILRPVIQRGDITTGTNLSIRPDIIYVILDGYGRSDALKRALDYSSDNFVQGLEKRGFYVAKDAHANYCQTELSVASSLNMNFVPELLPKISSKETNRSPLDVIIDNNQVALYLRERGYTFSAITTGFPPLQFKSADVNLRSHAGMNLIESALIQQTPFAGVPGLYGSMFARRRDNILSAFATLETLSAQALNPRFTVVHILAPHPPFVFGSHGEVRARKGSFGFFDGSDYMLNVSTAKDYRDGYVGQAEFIGNRTLKALDKMLARSSSKPVILIQGDHGSKLRLDQAFFNKTDFNECFPNLSAFYVPESVRKNLYPGMTPVNSFRVLFNGLFDDKLELKPDRSWYSSFPFPYDFMEVTNRLVDHTKMASLPLPR
jgi:hypothetical protein